MKLIFRIAFFLFIFFLVNCKKDKKDTQPPTITFITPTNAQAYKMFDTIAVSARVGDNLHLSYVNVTLTDANHSPVEATVSVPITSMDFIFNIKYFLTQFHLQSGNYNIQITTDDGYNTTSSYQPIYITESPTQLWGYCMVSKNNSQIINQVDTSNHYISSIPFSQPYNGMKYGTYYQQLYVNGNNTRAFQSFNLQQSSNSQFTYNVSATVSQQNYTCLNTDGYKPYIGFLNSDVNSIENTGSYSTSYRLNDNTFYPYYFTKTSLYGVGIFKKSNNTSISDKIVTFGSFGAVYNSLSLAGNTPITHVLAVFEKAQDSLYVLGNDINNQAVIGFYSPSGNAFAAYVINGSGKMLSAAKINNEQILISTTTGIYPINGLSISTALSSIVAQKILYQPKLNMVTIASQGNLNAYKLGANSLSLISTRSFILSGDSIVDFEVITNK